MPLARTTRRDVDNHPDAVLADTAERAS
jgi:hypothetical protein